MLPKIIVSSSIPEDTILLASHVTLVRRFDPDGQMSEHFEFERKGCAIITGIGSPDEPGEKK